MSPGDFVCQTWRDGDTDRAGNPTPQHVYRIIQIRDDGVARVERHGTEYSCRVTDFRFATDDEKDSDWQRDSS